jgi:hypothetical protein
MKIEVGQKYKTRKGGIVEIVRWEQHNFLFPFIGVSDCGIETTYNEIGHVHLIGKSPNDLVEEYKKSKCKQLELPL